MCEEEREVMTATIELNSARRKLQSALGEAQKEYFTHLKNWFRKRISKDEFDCEARKLLSAENAHRHNEFLLAILNKCQTLANINTTTPNNPGSKVKVELVATSDLVTPPPKGKKSKVKVKKAKSASSFNNSKSVLGPSGGFEQRFQSLVPNNNNNPQQRFAEPELYQEEKKLRYLHREFSLPDVSLVHGRMLVICWEERLDEVEDDAAKLVLKAVETQMKDIITALIMKRKGFKMRDDKFPFAVGSKRPNPYLFNTENRLHGKSLEVVSEENNEDEMLEPICPTARPTRVEAEQEVMLEQACAEDALLGASAAVYRPLSLFDLMRLLQERRSVIPNHTVYTLNMERIISRLYHPGHTD